MVSEELGGIHLSKNIFSGDSFSNSKERERGKADDRQALCR